MIEARENWAWGQLANTSWYVGHAGEGSERRPERCRPSQRTSEEALGYTLMPLVTFWKLASGCQESVLHEKKKSEKLLFKKNQLPYSKFLKTTRLEWLERNDWCFSLFWDIITVHLFSFKIPERTNTIMP